MAPGPSTLGSQEALALPSQGCEPGVRGLLGEVSAVIHVKLGVAVVLGNSSTWIVWEGLHRSTLACSFSVHSLEAGDSSRSGASLPTRAGLLFQGPGFQARAVPFPEKSPRGGQAAAGTRSQVHSEGAPLLGLSQLQYSRCLKFAFSLCPPSIVCITQLSHLCPHSPTWSTLPL